MDEDLIKVIVFIVIALFGALSGLKKKFEEKDEQKRMDNLPFDLPDSVRETLSKKAITIKVAKPRTTSGGELEDGWKAVPPPEKPLVVARPAQPARPSTRNVRDTTRPTPTPRPPQGRPTAQPPIRTAKPTTREADTGPHIHPQDVQVLRPPHPEQLRTVPTSLLTNKPVPVSGSGGPTQPVQQPQRPPTQPFNPAATSGAPCPRHAMPFHNLNDIRRGIILSEILGRPVSLREE